MRRCRLSAPRRTIRLAGAGLVLLLAAGAALPAALETSAETPAQTPAETPAQPFRAPYRPTDDAEVLQPVPTAADPDVAEIRRLTARLAREPRRLDLANALAKAYIDFGRRLGDAHYVGYAEAVIAPWLSSPAPPASTLVIEATILQYRHQFQPARERLVRALAVDRRNAQAWLTLATLDMVQGDYPAAARNCEEVVRAGGDIVGLACSANVASYLGQARRAIATLTAVNLRARGLPDNVSSWIEGLIAESSERLGDWPAVEAHYRQALSRAPDDNFLLVAYADFLLDRGRPAEVLTLLAPYAQSDTAFLRLVLAKAALKSPELPRYAWVMSARFQALAERGDDLFGREQVRFALHAQNDARTALELAQQNWRVQRAPWDVRVLLEAARAADDPKAAEPVLDFVDRTKLEDPVIAALARDLRARLGKAPS